MEMQYGFIHGKLEIKALILFILRHLPLPTPEETLAELVLCDDGITYFDYAECTAELVASGHVQLLKDGYVVTDKGQTDGETMENDVSYSVRLKAEKAAAVVASAQRRSTLIRAQHELRRKGGYTVKLSLSDGMDTVMQMELYAANEAQAEQIENKFRKDAEASYGKIMKLLLGEE